MKTPWNFSSIMCLFKTLIRDLNTDFMKNEKNIIIQNKVPLFFLPFIFNSRIMKKTAHKA